MWHVYFDVLSMTFWLAVGALFLVEIIVAENEGTGWGFIVLAGWLLGMMLFSEFNPFPWMLAHWVTCLVLLVAYVLVGVGYTFFRWWLLINDPDEYARKSWSTGEKKVLQPSWYKERLVTYMMWWPPSLAWWLLRWPRKLFVALYNNLAAQFTKMAQNASPGTR